MHINQSKTNTAFNVRFIKPYKKSEPLGVVKAVIFVTSDDNLKDYSKRQFIN